MVNRTPFFSQEKYYTEIAGKLKLWGFYVCCVVVVMAFFLSFGVVFFRLQMCINNLEYKGVLQNKNRIIWKTESLAEIEIRTQIQK